MPCFENRHALKGILILGLDHENKEFIWSLAGLHGEQWTAEDTVLKVSRLKIILKQFFTNMALVQSTYGTLNITIKFYAPDLTKVLSSNL